MTLTIPSSTAGSLSLSLRRREMCFTSVGPIEFFDVLYRPNYRGNDHLPSAILINYFNNTSACVYGQTIKLDDHPIIIQRCHEHEDAKFIFDSSTRALRAPLHIPQRLVDTPPRLLWSLLETFYLYAQKPHHTHNELLKNQIIYVRERIIRAHPEATEAMAALTNAYENQDYLPAINQSIAISTALDGPLRY